ncbi:ADP-ribose pyrophosphatase [bacterium HR39]|nr:ADP-ribose pyrophosphatase [bacterium HR39]
MPRTRLHWEILDRRRLHDGFYRFELLKVRHERFARDWPPPLSRELLVQRDAVAVLPYDPRRDVVVLIEQFRVGALHAAEGPWLLEAVAGLVEPGETPEQVARRELVEEAGLEARRVVHAGAYRSSPGGTSERVEVFVAEVEAPHSSGVFGHPDEHEDIRTVPMPAEDAFARRARGEITAATAVFPLLWLEAHRVELRRRWLEHGDGESE